MKAELEDLAKELGELAAALESNGSRAGVALLLRHAEERLRGRASELEAAEAKRGTR